MIALALILLTAPEPQPQIETCAAAVHGALASAVTACAGRESVDVLDGRPGVSVECAAALAAGQRAGKFGPGLPDAMRAGLVRDFDAKADQCRNQKPRQETKTLPQTQLWD